MVGRQLHLMAQWLREVIISSIILFEPFRFDSQESKLNQKFSVILLFMAICGTNGCLEQNSANQEAKKIRHLNGWIVLKCSLMLFPNFCWAAKSQL